MTTLTSPIEQRLGPVLMKLNRGARLSPDDEAAVAGAFGQTRRLPANHPIISEGERPHKIFAVLDGFAMRHFTVKDGGRQVLAWLIPGDWCDLNAAVLGSMDHSIVTVSETRVAEITPEAVFALRRHSDALAQSLWWSTLVDSAILRHWLVSVGRRSATQRMAHFFCELFVRMHSVGLSEKGGALALPLTQIALADTLGLSAVHVNRTLRELKEAANLEWRDGVLTIRNLSALQELAGFDPSYLHLAGREVDNARLSVPVRR